MNKYFVDSLMLTFRFRTLADELTKAHPSHSSISLMNHRGWNKKLKHASTTP
jgi:hypothetical protein